MAHGVKRAALVTGASRGIGYELASVLARHGNDLLLVARSEGELRGIAEAFESRHRVEVAVLACDLSDPAAPQQILTEVQNQGRQIDILVNNAGFGMHGPFAEADLQGMLALLQVNVVALTHLTRLFLPGMMARRRGRILNVSSTAAYLPGPLMAVYYASKAYVQSFSEALADETAGSGVTVTALTPGPTRTGFWQAAHMEETRLASSRREMTAEQVALAGYEGLLAGRSVVIPGARNRMLTTFARLAPRALTMRFARREHGRRTRAPR